MIKTLHFDMIFEKDGEQYRRDAFLVQDEMFNTFRFVLFWTPMWSTEEPADNVILRGQYPNVYTAIKGLRDIPNLKKVRTIVDIEMMEVEEFIKSKLGKEV